MRCRASTPSWRWSATGRCGTQLETRCRAAGVARIASHFVGFRQSVGRFYAAVDAVALTSANEGTPVTLIEALAAGRPGRRHGRGRRRPTSCRTGHPGSSSSSATRPALAERLGTACGRSETPPPNGRSGASRCRERATRFRASSTTSTSCTGRCSQQRLASAAPDLPSPTVPAEARSAARARQAAPRALRIVLVSQYFPPEIGATQSRMQAFAEYLADARPPGHRDL